MENEYAAGAAMMENISPNEWDRIAILLTMLILIATRNLWFTFFAWLWESCGRAFDRPGKLDLRPTDLDMVDNLDDLQYWLSLPVHHARRRRHGGDGEVWRLSGGERVEIQQDGTVSIYNRKGKMLSQKRYPEKQLTGDAKVDLLRPASLFFQRHRR